MSPQQQPSNESPDSVEKFKTELCRKFALTGFCRYGDMCQFAHGAHELRALVRHLLYKTSACKSFEATGVCRYGTRCRFIHDEPVEHLAHVARGVPSLNLQVSEPSWEEAEAAVVDAVQHLGLSPQSRPGVGMSPPPVPLLSSTPISTTMGSGRLPVMPPLTTPVTSPKHQAVYSMNGSMDKPKRDVQQHQHDHSASRTLSLGGRIKTMPSNMSERDAMAASDVAGIRSISSLILNPSPASPSMAQRQGGDGNSTKVDDMMGPPDNLDVRRMPVASHSWVSVADAALEKTFSPNSAASMNQSNSAASNSMHSAGMRHSASTPAMADWSFFGSSGSTSAFSRSGGGNGVGNGGGGLQNSERVASLPALPPTSPMNGNLPESASFTSSTAPTSRLLTPQQHDESQNFRKAASFANQIWFDNSASSSPNQVWGGGNAAGSSNMSRAQSVDARLDIFRTLSDQDLAKMAAEASGPMTTTRSGTSTGMASKTVAASRNMSDQDLTKRSFGNKMRMASFERLSEGVMSEGDPDTDEEGALGF